MRTHRGRLEVPGFTDGTVSSPQRTHHRDFTLNDSKPAKKPTSNAAPMAPIMRFSSRVRGGPEQP
jgi:hypothetical protein